MEPALDWTDWQNSERDLCPSACFCPPDANFIPPAGRTVKQQFCGFVL